MLEKKCFIEWKPWVLNDFNGIDYVSDKPPYFSLLQQFLFLVFDQGEIYAVITLDLLPLLIKATSDCFALLGEILINFSDSLAHFFLLLV